MGLLETLYGASQGANQGVQDMYQRNMQAGQIQRQQALEGLNLGMTTGNRGLAQQGLQGLYGDQAPGLMAGMKNYFDQKEMDEATDPLAKLHAAGLVPSQAMLTAAAQRIAPILGMPLTVQHATPGSPGIAPNPLMQGPMPDGGNLSQGTPAIPASTQTIPNPELAGMFSPYLHAGKSMFVMGPYGQMVQVPDVNAAASNQTRLTIAQGHDTTSKANTGTRAGATVQAAQIGAGGKVQAAGVTANAPKAVGAGGSLVTPGGKVLVTTPAKSLTPSQIRQQAINDIGAPPAKPASGDMMGQRRYNAAMNGPGGYNSRLNARIQQLTNPASGSAKVSDLPDDQRPISAFDLIDKFGLA